jgi:hypothetical protein
VEGSNAVNPSREQADGDVAPSRAVAEKTDAEYTISRNQTAPSEQAEVAEEA